MDIPLLSGISRKLRTNEFHKKWQKEKWRQKLHAKPHEREPQHKCKTSAHTLKSNFPALQSTYFQRPQTKMYTISDAIFWVGLVFHALSHDMIVLLGSVSPRNHFRTGQNSPPAYQNLPFIWLRSHLTSERYAKN